jgi:glycosyltransferase involved in cell wall biosynthesis
VKVTVYARDAYVPESREYMGVRVVALPSPSGKGWEALGHTRTAIRAASDENCDILHVHSLGPSVLIPYARSRGHRCIVSTVHALDYTQAKWSYPVRRLLKRGERMAATRADGTIAVADWIAERLRAEYGRDVTVIPNGPGLTDADPVAGAAVLEELGVTPGGYVLFVGRLIPDKRVEDLVAAVTALGGGLKLVVAGDSSDTDSYANHLRELANESVVMPGYVYGDELAALYANSVALVLPSQVEGLPLCLLEGMAFGTPVVASDIAANREVLSSAGSGLVYPVGDVSALTACLRSLVADPELRSELVEGGRRHVSANYEWSQIARSTLDVYRSACK